MIESKIVDEHVETYIRALLPEATGLLGELELFAREAFVPIVHPEVAQYLRLMTQLRGPKRVLEIGTAIGYSASLMAMTMGRGTIDTIELSDTMAEKAAETFGRLKTMVPEVDVRLYKGEAQDVLRTLKGPYDMIFIDASKSHYREFLDLCLPMLGEDGVILSDNVLFKGMVATDAYVIKRKRTIVKRMREYLDYISEHPQLTTSVLPMGDGVAVTLKRR
ncbi:O-methyltransferase [Fusibacter sp. JL298sf-3]